MKRDVAIFLGAYPKVFFACHRRHVRDGGTGRVISRHQAAILDHLDDVRPVHLHRLAGHMGVTASTMSLNIDRLEAGGFVVRGKDLRDKRRVNLLLTAAGKRIKEQEQVLDSRLVGALLRRLNGRERAAAIGGLRALARAAEGLMGSAEFKKVAAVEERRGA